MPCQNEELFSLSSLLPFSSSSELWGLRTLLSVFWSIHYKKNGLKMGYFRLPLMAQTVEILTRGSRYLIDYWSWAAQ